MNLLSVVSLLLSIIVLAVTILTASNNPSSFLDVHGLLVVLGGTFAAAAVSIQPDKVVMLLKVYVERTIRGRKIDYQKVIRQLMLVAESVRKEDPNLDSMIKNFDDNFLKDALTLALDESMEKGSIVKVLYQRSNTLFERYHMDASRFKGLGKYPPAMGLLGAVTGMISLLGGLGKPGAEKTMGPAMSIALVATLYGIAFANFFVIPIGESLMDSAKEMKRKNEIIIQGVRLILEGTNPVLMEEELNSYLLPAERVDRKKLGSAA
ncbi:MAG: transporter, MotA/TolQ/ExbB proton channel family protein [Pseudomonadota bacterium]|jgi:chemotaxis protein MotA